MDSAQKDLPTKPPDEPPPPPPPPSSNRGYGTWRARAAGMRSARARVAHGGAIIGMVLMLVLGLGCAAAAGGASMAQSALENYHILPTAGAAPDGQAAPVIGAISVRGAGISGHGQASIELVHVEGSAVTRLYHAEVSVVGCSGVELSAEGGTFRLIRTTARRALEIWPMLPCARNDTLLRHDSPEVLFSEPMRGTK